jgi:hypothetical protein
MESLMNPILTQKPNCKIFKGNKTMDYYTKEFLEPCILLVQELKHGISP